MGIVPYTVYCDTVILWRRCVASDPSQRSRSCCHIGYFSKDQFLTCSDFPAIYLHTHPTEFLLCLQIHCLCSVFSGTLSFVYSIQIVVVSDDTTTVCPHLIVFYLSSTECSHPLSSTTESDSVFYSRCLP